MDSAAPSGQSPLVQPKKSRRFVAGAAASAVLGLLAVTAARSSVFRKLPPARPSLDPNISLIRASY